MLGNTALAAMTQYETMRQTNGPRKVPADGCLHQGAVRTYSFSVRPTPKEAQVAAVSSKRIAGLVGPTMVAMLISEFPLVQPHLYDAQIPPVVYLSGTLMFVAGLAIVRAHNHWARDWTVLVTLSGWLALVLGLFRMFSAGLYLRGSAQTSPTVIMVLESILLTVGLIMTVKAYRRGSS